MAKHRQQAIYALLTKYGPMEMPDMAECMGVSQQIVVSALRFMKANGMARKQSAKKCAMWELVPGAPLPQDKRGRHRNSWANLALGTEKAREKREGAAPPPIPCALADCWGWMPRLEKGCTEVYGENRSPCTPVENG